MQTRGIPQCWRILRPIFERTQTGLWMSSLDHSFWHLFRTLSTKYPVICPQFVCDIRPMSSLIITKQLNTEINENKYHLLWRIDTNIKLNSFWISLTFGDFEEI